jgi:hypothetical protein
MTYKVLFFNSQSGCGFISDFITEGAASAAADFFRDKHYNNTASVIDDFPEVKTKPKSKK